MKKNFPLLFLFLLGVVLFSCKDDDNEIIPKDYFDVPEPDSVFFKTTAGEETIALKTNLYVTPELPAEAASWCEVVFYPIPPRVIIKTKENLNGEPRSTKVVLKTEQFQHSLYIEQLGQAPAIRLFQETYRVGQKDTTLCVPFIANVTPTIKSLANWINCSNITTGQQTDTLRLNISSTKEIRRTGDVELSFEGTAKQILHIIQQSNDTTYTPSGTVGLYTKIAISQIESNPEFQDLEQLYDGNISTTWQNNSGIENLPVNLDFYFENTDRLDQMIYYPGIFGGSTGLQKFDLYVKSEGDSDFKRYGETFDFKGDGLDHTINFTESIKNPRIIRLRITTAKEMVGKYYLGAAEFEFYKQNTDLSAIFTDATCSALKEEVTFDQIMAIEDDFIRNLAQHIYAGTYDSEFRVQEYLPYTHPDVQKENHISRAWGFLDNVTGILAEADEPLVIFVGDTHGEKISLHQIDWETDHHPSPYRLIPLTEGANVLYPYQRGFLYITYFTDQPQNKKPIKIHIASGKVNGYFDITKPGHDNAYWQKLLATRAKYKYLDVKGKECHLNFLTEQYQAYCPTDIESVISACDSVIYLEHELSGIYKYSQNRSYPNRMLCRYTTETGNFLAHASDYFTCYIQGAVKGILDVHTLKKEPWAMAHELGHVHQNRNITWKGMTEVSNNVFSLYVQTTFGSVSRLIQENRYQEAYDQIAIAGGPYMTDQEIVFARLVPLWQLQLYFAKLGKQPDFYPDLYESMRLQGELATDSEKLLNFIKLCCKTGNMDLREFFSFYGFLTPSDQTVNNDRPLFTVTQEKIDETITEIGQMNLNPAPALQYLTDENVNLFRQNKAVEKGSVQITGNNLILKDWQNVAAYEVRKSGKLIQVSLQPEFTLKENSSDITVYAIAADGTATPVNLN